MLRIISIFAAGLMIALQGCTIANPSLTYDFIPAGKLAGNNPPVRKIVIMKPLDIRGHAGTTPGMKAFIPFYPYVREIREPEAFTYDWNAYRFDYEMDFTELVAMDLRASVIAVDVVASPETTQIPALITGKNPPDYIIKLKLNRLDWQKKFTMYGVSVIGYLPQALGAPDEYGFAYLKFSAEIFDAQGRPVATRTFSATESQNSWLYYFTGYLRALTRAYAQVSPDFRRFVADSVAGNTP
jgi:hypothetical protein